MAGRGCEDDLFISVAGGVGGGGEGGSDKICSKLRMYSMVNLSSNIIFGR